MATSGIDVSEWQGVIDWAKAKSQIDFALIRAGYGDTLSYPAQVDYQYERNYSECKRLGIPLGIYFYCYAKTTAEAEREADCCLALLKGKRFEFPIYYDVEEMSVFKTGKTGEICKAFIDKLERLAIGWASIHTGQRWDISRAISKTKRQWLSQNTVISSTITVSMESGRTRQAGR